MRFIKGTRYKRHLKCTSDSSVKLQSRGFITAEALSSSQTSMYATSSTRHKYKRGKISLSLQLHFCETLICLQFILSSKSGCCKNQAWRVQRATAWKKECWSSITKNMLPWGNKRKQKETSSNKCNCVSWRTQSVYGSVWMEYLLKIGWCGFCSPSPHLVW